MIKRLLDWLEPGVKDFFTVACIVLRATLKMLWKFLDQVFGVLAAWVSGIPKACSDVADEWAKEANRSNMGKLSRPIHHIVYVLAWIEIVVISILIAHVIVFVTFWLFFL